MKRMFMEEKLIVYLMILKITPNLKGYGYLKEAVMCVCEDRANKYHMSSRLYQELSVKFNEKASLIDRALRHAMEVSYKRDGFAAFEKTMRVLFSDSKPSAREVICMLAEKLNLEIMKNQDKYDFLR